MCRCFQIIPPKEYIPRRHGYEDVKITIPAPVKQMLNGRKGVYQLFNIQQKPLTVKEFERIANDDVYADSFSHLCLLLDCFLL